MNKCIVMRGVPGSGKSTEASRLYDQAIAEGRTAVIHSTDNFFMVEGVYVFNQDKIGQHHRSNQEAARQSMRQGINTVIIDNTNTTAKEIFPYLEMAFDRDYEVEFAEPSSPWWLAAVAMLKGKRSADRLSSHAKVFAARNTHNVPEFAISKMLERFQLNLTLDDIISAGRL